jgi:RNA polymerase sigma-70 factor (ECF subfamily)
LFDPAEAEEATQDTFVAMLNALHRYRGEAAFTTWLYAITVNLCRDRLRKRRSRERLAQALQALARHPTGKQTGGASEAHAIQRETGDAIRRAVESLGEKHRLPVILRYYQDWPVAEIARVLGISEGTVHSRLSTARDRLRAALRDQGILAAEMDL